MRLNQVRYDVVVIGGGSSGVAASIAAARNGARTLLVDVGPMIGGELLSGIPVDGCLTSRGDWAVGGVARELFDECRRLDGYVGDFFDYRSLWLVCVDPEVMKVAVINRVHQAGVDLLLYTFAEDVVVEDGRVTGIVVLNKNRRTLVTADLFIDCSGDGDIAVAAGAPWEAGGAGGAFQPVSMIFRMSGVAAEPLLRFVRDHPENCGLAETPAISLTPEECARRLYDQGLPKIFFDGKGPLLMNAIAAGELFACPMIGVTPVSLPRKEVSLNTTRINLDATDTTALSRALPDLMAQVQQCAAFLKKRVPGFEAATFAGLAPRIGIRETRRIMGEYVLTASDVLEAKKRPDGIAKGCHELDVHGVGNQHRRDMIAGGGSYDIPFGCLLPKGLSNLMVAGRCLSATREAHGSARVMGTCMAMGQAAGTAAAMARQDGAALRQLSVQALRDRLQAQGAVLDGIA